MISLFYLGHPSSSAKGLWNTWLSGLLVGLEPHQSFSWASSVQTTDHGTSQLPKLCDNQPFIINLLLYISLCILLVLFSLESPN